MTDPAPEISVVVPVYNEAESIVPLLQELQVVLEETFAGRFEILVVDDGSTDESVKFIDGVTSFIPEVRLIQLETNSGQSLALCSGFSEALGEWIVTLDGDGQNDPGDLPELFNYMTEADAVFGYRIHRKDTLSKRLGGILANAVRNILLGEDIKDTGCSLKLFKRSFTEALIPWDGMHRFLGTLFLMQQATIVQVPVHHRARTAGNSKYTNAGRLKKTWGHLMAIRKGPEGFLRMSS